MSIAAVPNPTTVHISAFSADVIFAGAPGVGLWKSSNRGSDWTATTSGGVCTWQYGNVGCGNHPWHNACATGVAMSTDSQLSMLGALSAWSDGTLDFGYAAAGRLVMAPGTAHSDYGRIMTAQAMLLWDSGCSAVTAAACTAAFCFAFCSGGPSLTTASVAGSNRYGAPAYYAPLQNDVLIFSRPFQGNFVTFPSCTLADGPTTNTAVTNQAALSFLSACAGSSTSAVIGAAAGVLLLSTNNGASWTQLSAAGTRSWVAAACSTDASTIFAAETAGAIFASYNSGQSWMRTSFDPTPTSSPSASATAPASSSTSATSSATSSATPTSTLCAAGTFRLGGLCAPCYPGTFSLAGASVCTLCPAGTFGNAAGLASAACSGQCDTCSAGTVYAAPSTSFSCVSSGTRSAPTSLSLLLWPAAHPQNPQHVDLIIAPLAVCISLTSAVTCAAAASIMGADGVVRYAVGTAGALHLEAAEPVSCSAVRA